MTISNWRNLLVYIDVLTQLRENFSKFRKTKHNFREEHIDLFETGKIMLDSILSLIFVLFPIKVGMNRLIDFLENEYMNDYKNGGCFLDSNGNHLLFNKHLFIGSKDNIFSEDIRFLNISKRLLLLSEQEKVAKVMFQTYFLRNSLQHERHNIDCRLAFSSQDTIFQLMFEIGYTIVPKEKLRIYEQTMKQNDRSFFLPDFSIRAGTACLEKEHSLELGISIEASDISYLLRVITKCYSDVLIEFEEEIKKQDDADFFRDFDDMKKTDIIEQLMKIHKELQSLI